MPTASVRWIDVCTLASGVPLRVAVHEIDGAGDGPTLGISALIHGDEVTGPEIIRRVRDALDPRRLRGRVRLLPVANPLAFQTGTRGMPLAVEVSNLNRVFPGDPAGDLPSRLARALEVNFLEEVTHLVDLHAGGTFPIVDYSISLRDLDLALAFGQRVVRQVEGYAGTMGALAASRQKASVVAEVGGGYALDGHYVEMGVRGVLNVMRHLGMLDGRPELPARQVVVREMATLRPGHGGLLYSQMGSEAITREVPKGTLLGRVVSPHTFETLEEFRAPFDRNVVLLLRPGVTPVNPGDYAYMLGNLEGARVVTNH
ncbi:MAG: succinylglutamate desuccinylase/aspartoacylase family protein [Armatimonadota bacterium]|nr:succinylglutamate desuccinylase/aspartoacylase family protein [Armatimonadota bacterium]